MIQVIDTKHVQVTLYKVSNFKESMHLLPKVRTLEKNVSNQLFLFANLECILINKLILLHE